MSALRLRRYLDGALVDEHVLEHVSDLAESHADWALAAGAQGLAWRIVLDDPTGERLAAAVILEGGPHV